ncbi:MAG: FecR domain-containing protein [Terriglobia bacterium]|jgi:ferric-dicitrate binding protein FerR (iron transport regulator)
MSQPKQQRDPSLGELINELRREDVSDQVVEQSADRVWAGLRERFPAPVLATTADVEKIRGCADFQTLLPAYLSGGLSAARAALVEDHLHGCVACRRALQEARHGARPAAGQVAEVAPSQRQPSATKTRWAVAWALAACMCLMGLSLFLESGRLARLIRGSEAQAAVLSTAGTLYLDSGRGGQALVPGRSIREDEEVRTAKASSAMIRMVDGSTIEMDQRTSFWISKGWRDTTLHLQRGSIIVRAAKQYRGRLKVATRDCLVSVKGTIFAVDEGMKGARVSVIQGEVEVEQGRKTQFLHPGEQVSTESDLAPVPVSYSVSWSRNRSEYLELLGEFAALHKQFESLPGPAPRYTSDLLNMVPADTMFYAAIPNMGSTLTEANRLLQERIQQSAVLQAWWARQQASGRASKEPELIDRLRSFSDYLGDEIVVAMTPDAHSPLVLAEVRRPDFRAFLQQQVSGIKGDGKQFQMQIVDNPSLLLRAAGTNTTLVYFRNNLVAMAADARQLQMVAPLMESKTSSGFTSTPFYSAIRQAYQAGAGLLICADMEQILAHSVGQKEGPSLIRDERTGLADMRYLIMESKDLSGRTENRATLTFAQPRRGLTALLGPPSPMGTLDFVSPTASFAVSFVVEDPKEILQELLSLAESHDPGFAQGLEDFESETGVNVSRDLAAQLGGEVTLALDGPTLPTPSWKVSAEVNDPARLEETIEKLVASYNSKADAKAGTLNLTKQDADGRTFYTLQINRPTAAPGVPTEIDYVFVDGNLLAAPSRALLLSSIQNRNTQYTLARSSDFSSRLPRDGFTNCSALVYQNLGAMLGSAVDIPILTPAEKQALETLKQNSGPSLTCAYGEPQEITIANTGNFFGLGFGPLLGIKGAGVLDLLPLLKGAAQGSSRQ